MLKDMLHHKIPIRVTAEPLRLFKQCANETRHSMSRRTMLNKPLKHATTILVLRSCDNCAFLLKFHQNKIYAIELHNLDELRQHVICMGALVHIHHTSSDLPDDCFPACPI